MTTALRIAGALAAALAAAGCVTETLHPWQTPGDHRHVTVDTGGWPVVAQELYCAVPEARIRDAAALLARDEAVPLSPQQERAFTEGFTRPADATLTPFLIRGVTVGHPTWSLLRRDPETGEVHIHRAMWNGENAFFTARGVEYGIWPLVLYAQARPRRVHATAAFGGDGIMMVEEPIDTRGARRPK